MDIKLDKSIINWNLVVCFLTFKQTSYFLPRVPTFIIEISTQPKNYYENYSLYCII